MSAYLQAQAKFLRSYERWNARRLAKHAADAASPETVARHTREGAQEARRNYATGAEPDNVWTRQDPFAVAWRDETTRLSRFRSNHDRRPSQRP